MRDTLAFSPGVYTQPRYGQEVRISIRGSGISRGFHMRGLMLLQDGAPINLADDNGDFQNSSRSSSIISKSIAAPMPCASARARSAAPSMA